MRKSWLSLVFGLFAVVALSQVFSISAINSAAAAVTCSKCYTSCTYCTLSESGGCKTCASSSSQCCSSNYGKSCTHSSNSYGYYSSTYDCNGNCTGGSWVGNSCTTSAGNYGSYTSGGSCSFSSCSGSCSPGYETCYSYPCYNSGQQYVYCRTDGDGCSKYSYTGSCSAPACCTSTCSSGQSQSQACTMANGTGVQYKYCSSGGDGCYYWDSGWGTCTPSGCNSGYHKEGNACVSNTTTCPAGWTGNATWSGSWNSGSWNYSACSKSCSPDTTANGSRAPVNTTIYCNAANCSVVCTYNATCNTGYSPINNGTASAACKANTYTVNYNGNTSFGLAPTTGSTAATTCTYDQNCTLRTNGFAKLGYSFAGWALTQAGANSKTADFPNLGTVKNLVPSGSTTLYAVWLRNPITCPPGTIIKCNGDVAECIPCPAGTICDGGIYEDNCPDCDTEADAPGCRDCLATPTPAGCLIDSCANYGGGAFPLSNAGSSLPEHCYKTTGCYPSSAVNAWSPNPATGIEHYTLNDDSCTYTVTNCAANRFKNPTKSNICAGFDSDCSCTQCPDGGLAPNANTGNGTTCYKVCPTVIPINNVATIERDQVNVYYGAANGTGSTYQTCTYTITCNPGYTVANNGTANPSCVANKYTVNFDVNGGDGGSTASIMCTFDQPCILPTSGFYKADYHFRKWMDDSDAADATGFWDEGGDAGNLTTVPNGVVTLYVDWELDYEICEPGYYNTLFINGVNECVPLCDGCEPCDDCLPPVCNPATQDCTGWVCNPAVETCATIICDDIHPYCNYHQCPRGTYMVKQPDGAHKCIPTPAGTYNEGEGNTGYTICGPSSYNVGTGNYDDTRDGGVQEGCMACPAGQTTIDADTSVTPLPEYHTGLGSCSGDCGDFATPLADIYSFLPTWWDVATNTVYSKKDGNPYLMQCAIEQCVPGTYRHDDYTCTVCAPGSYTPTNNDLDACILCPAGQYQGDPKATECIDCAPGAFADKTGSTICQLCDIGMIAPLPGSEICEYCVGKTTIGTGSTECDEECYKDYVEQWNKMCEVVTCEAGHYYSGDPRNPVDNGSGNCDGLCAPGYYCPVGSIDDKGTTLDPKCDPIMGDCPPYTGEHWCSDGWVSGIGAGICTQCPSGAISNLTSIPGGYTVTDGSWSVPPYANVSGVLDKSPSLPTAGPSHHTECWFCGAGMQPNAAHNACEPCPAGTYRTSDMYTLDKCIACPPNSQCLGGSEEPVCLPGFKTEKQKDDTIKCVEIDTICDVGEYGYGTVDNVTGECVLAGCLGDHHISADGKRCEKNRAECVTAGGTGWKDWNGTAYDECIETSCYAGFQMVDDTCVECNRENALTYLAGGNCIIDTCRSGFHTEDGLTCISNVISCEVPHATIAQRVWANGQYGVCTALACEYDYHLSSNACVRNTQACTIENGIGHMEWVGDTLTGGWSECYVTSCNPGYSNDPSETNERSKPCGVCNNRYGVNGEIAVASYSAGCEIAACMYQGELYNLDNNECVPICSTNGQSDETGTMSWNPTTKKCDITCAPGYMKW